MKKLTLAALTILCFFLIISPSFVHTETAVPSAGHTGAPGELTCNTAGCHTGSPINLEISKFTLSSVSTPDISTGYTPNSIYNLFVNITSSNPVWGFELTALDVNNNAAGTFTKTNLANTELTTLNNRQYMSHKAATSTPAWTFRWQAPATDIGEINFYFTGVAGNDDNAATGDVVYRGQAEVTTSAFTQLTLTGTGVAPINADDVNSLSIFPNPISDKLTVQYYLHEAKQMKVELLDLNGRVVKQLDESVQVPGVFQRSFNFDEKLTAGIYLLKITEGEQVYLKKLLAE